MTAAVSAPQTQYATINGIRVVTGSITIPYYGAWVADVSTETGDPLTSAATIVIGGLTLVGTIYRSAAFGGSRTARVVAGAAGWRQPLTQRGYYLAGGVPVAMVLGDAAKELGETVKGAAGLLNTHWTRPAGMLGRDLLAMLAGPLWWIDTNGVTQIATTRPGSQIQSQFDVINQDGGKGLFDIATETLSDWMPGNMFQSSTVTDNPVISTTRIDVGNDGKLRLAVMTVGSVDE